MLISKLSLADTKQVILAILKDKVSGACGLREELKTQVAARRVNEAIRELRNEGLIQLTQVSEPGPGDSDIDTSSITLTEHGRSGVLQPVARSIL